MFIKSKLEQTVTEVLSTISIILLSFKFVKTVARKTSLINQTLTLSDFMHGRRFTSFEKNYWLQSHFKT